MVRLCEHLEMEMMRNKKINTTHYSTIQIWTLYVAAYLINYLQKKYFIVLKYI